MVTRAVRREQERILSEAYVRARAAAPAGVVVLDLDGTLLDNRPRQARIAQDYGAATGLRVLAGARAADWGGWDLEAGLVASGLAPALARQHRTAFLRFWAERFFTSAYCTLDVPTPGAPAFARALAAAGARLAYVTGRPSRMEDGTLHVLRRHGFPLPDGARARLLLKPSDDLDDDGWKAIAREAVNGFGPAVAAFDNEPAHVNAYARAWPGALAVHVDTDHSPRPIEVLPRIPSIADFRAAFLSAAEADATAAAR